MLDCALRSELGTLVRMPLVKLLSRTANFIPSTTLATILIAYILFVPSSQVLLVLPVLLKCPGIGLGTNCTSSFASTMFVFSIVRAKRAQISITPLSL